MNASLVLLNAMALIALFTFHTASDRVDPAQVHIDTAHWVQRPAAQFAAMAPQHIRTSMVREPAGGNAVEEVSAAPAPVERYVF